jgi:A/G-specific adenine glycosylase
LYIRRAAAATLRRRLLRWYARSARDLPWRHTRDEYAVLVSEVMLQQTQVSRVLPAYTAFLRRFPTLAALSRAALADVLRAWSGLGYNRRARDLHRIARLHPRALPATREGLDLLPGVGSYTAGAVTCFSRGESIAFADTNIRRVLGRALLGRVASEREAVALDEQLVPDRGADRWHHALMDLGATICKPVPRCAECPLNGDCEYARGSAGTAVGAAAVRHHDRALRPAAFKDTDRRIRGAIVKALTRVDLTMRALENEIGDERVGRLTEGLIADGLVERAGRRYRLPL